MSPLLQELEELYAGPSRLDALREKVKAKDEGAARMMLYFDIWKRLRETRGPFSLEQKFKAMEDTLSKFEDQVNLLVSYG